MEVMKDYFTESIDEIKCLKQLDQTPNLELKESKWELYKISLSFSYAGFYNLLTLRNEIGPILKIS